jgi:hypothetical protein
MKLDARQTRRLLLAGAVPFPKPYPSIGRISVERTKLVYSRLLNKLKTLIVVQEQHKSDVTRLFVKSGVAAIFIAGAWVRVSRDGWVFRFSRQHAVHNFERGEWFLGPEISVDAIRTRLKKPKLAIDKRGNPARGIVFVYEDRPVMTVTEVVQTAGSIDPCRTGRYCCDCDGYPCDPCCYGEPDASHRGGLRRARYRSDTSIDFPDPEWCDPDPSCDYCYYGEPDTSGRGGLRRAPYRSDTSIDFPEPEWCDPSDDESGRCCC